MRELKLALRLFSRDWRSGELRIVILSLLVAIGGLTAIAVVVDRVERGMTRETSQVLGADRVIRSSYPLPQNKLEQISRFGLRRSDSIRFSTMVVAHNDFQLVSVRAVDKHFPLAGTLSIGDQPYAPGKTTIGAPASGTVWVSPRLMQALQLKINESIEIGVQTFTVAGVIETEPGSVNLIDFAPNLIMALGDVPVTKVIQPGSRIGYHYSFAGDEAALQRLDEWSKAALDAGERLIGAEENSPALQSALGRARGYLNLSGLLGMLLGSVAIAIVSNRYIRRHFDHAALLRCIGLKQNSIFYVYGMILLFAALIGATAGVLVGYLLQHLIITFLADWLPDRIPAARANAIGLGYITGILIVAGFSMPGLLRIRRVTPMRVLRKDLTPMPTGAWLIIGSALTSLGLVMWRYTLDIKLVLIVLGGSVVLTAVFGGLAQLLLRILNATSHRAPMPVRFGISHLLRHREATLTQSIAFGLILTLMLTVYLVRNELIGDWQKQLPANTPNNFVINLPPADVQAFEDFLHKHAIAASEAYPMVRGRIIKINGETPAEKYGEHYEQVHNSLRRDLNLSWGTTLQKSNRIIQGTWQTKNPDGISVEQEMAETLGLHPGDTLTFDIGGLTTSGTVTSIRKVEWDSFEPNFYVIFRPGKLDHYGATYISSFYLPPQQNKILNTMLEQFPSISIVETDRILQQVRSILHQASLAVEFVLLFVIAAGLVVLFATTYATLDEKQYEAGVLRALGAGRKTVLVCTASEYWLLAAVAGITAIACTEVIALALYHFVFKIEPVLHGWLWWTAPLMAMLLIVPAGLFAIRNIINTQPMMVLNKY